MTLRGPFASRVVLFALSAAVGCGISAGQTVDQVKQLLAEPPREYSSGPLWTWNDMLTEEQIVSTMQDMADQHVRQVWVHPRPGLMTPYLSDDWFRLWKIALREAERLDMNVWIYDENSYPSGFAGGFVPEALPEARGIALAWAESETPPAWSDALIAVYRLDGPRAEHVSDAVRAGQELPKGRYLVARKQPVGSSPWFGGRFYVDLLRPGVTQKFIEVTCEAYRREIGEQFGKRVPGIFTDEPHLISWGGTHWNDALPELFQQRWGYSLIEQLPALRHEIGDWRRVRHNYQQLLLELFIDRWAKPMFEYCEEHGLEFTGHYWEHGWPGASHGPDNMAMAAWQQRPGIDTLMNQYNEGPNAQFGNVRAVKEIGSVANQLGYRRTLCEAYGAAGWELRLEDMKRIGDWLYVLGVNTLNQHLSYVTIRGARKRDHPSSFSYHSPWWSAYGPQADYFARLSAVLSQGEQVHRILVLEPTTSGWMYQGHGQLKPLGDDFQRLVTELSQQCIEYDLGSESILALHGATRDAELIVGRRAYTTVVLPQHNDNLNRKTVELLNAYLAAGGRVLCCGAPPTRIDGAADDRATALADRPSWKQVDAAELVERLRPLQGDDFAIRQSGGGGSIVYHHRRRLDDGEVLFLVNTSDDEHACGEITSPLGSVEHWNLQAGTCEPGFGTRTETGVRTSFCLPPSGSLLLVFKPTGPLAAPRPSVQQRDVSPTGPMTIQRLAPNVLVLDYCDVTAGGETRSGVYCCKAGQFAFQQNGLPGNPWDRGVQFRDEIIRRKFADDSGFTATYRFTIESQVPASLALVVERGDLYSITCNGKPVAAKTDAWWLDRAFTRIDIAKLARAGENEVTITASPMTIFHELEPAYVLGEFRLRPTDRGFVIVPDAPMTTADRKLSHATDPEGSMWLSSGVGFTEMDDALSDDRRPSVTFDLGREVRLSGVRIWNYGEAVAGRDLQQRGVKRLQINGGADRDRLSFRAGPFELQRADAVGSRGQHVRLDAPPVRFVRFDVLDNHYGQAFPVGPDDAPPDNAFAGLAEVQFIDQDNRRPLTGVRIAGVSSELTAGFNRRAAYLVDGSGLGTEGGWNRMGHPFYGHGVAYRQVFDVPQPKGRYVVSLGNRKWHGSVARVDVNGEPAGQIAHRPYSCDVTSAIQPGENVIEVVVFGTLKNTLGPHHAGQLRGAAWPGQFHQGPATGPPPGEQYDTIGYGLFEPFELREQVQ